jgi:hypothetical protein
VLLRRAAEHQHNEVQIMAKKVSKSKRSRGKRPGIPRDPATGQQFIFDPATGEPTRRYRSRKATAAEIEAARERQRERSRKAAARRAAFCEKQQRHDDAERRFTLPDDVRLFLERLYNEPYLPWDQPYFAREQVEELLREVYVQGCTEGYIEGRALGLERDRRVSKKRHQLRRQKRQDCGGQMMTLDERDAAIVAEFPALRKMLGSIDAQWRLAEKYGLISREQVGNILRKAKLNGTA